MAKIISSRKKYVPVKDLKVYPSNKETIEVIPDDCNGAHRYRAQMCAGFVNGKPSMWMLLTQFSLSTSTKTVQ